MAGDLDISVIIATYNRADILAETLENMSRLDRDDINAEFVIVDNNSCDQTKDIIANFSKSLPIKYLFEPKPGQNYARNRALEQANLGKIVAFTDDDIYPHRDWLKAIISASEKWPNYSVFGGKIYIIWPNVKIPQWAHSSQIKSFAFAEHDYGDSECSYQPGLGKYPFSGNFWVRRQIFADGMRFDDAVAWAPNNQILATETKFLSELWQGGYRFIYCPESVVGHRITEKQLSIKYLIKRSYSAGRGVVHTDSLCREKLLNKHPAVWRFIRAGAIAKLGLELGLSSIPLAFKKPEYAMEAMRWIGYNVESLNIVRQRQTT